MMRQLYIIANIWYGPAIVQAEEDDCVFSDADEDNKAVEVVSLSV